jgi:hypothetical protein
MRERRPKTVGLATEERVEELGLGREAGLTSAANVTFPKHA